MMTALYCPLCYYYYHYIQFLNSTISNNVQLLLLRLLSVFNSHCLKTELFEIIAAGFLQVGFFLMTRQHHYSSD